MDKTQMKTVLNKLVAERAVHQETFAGQPLHQGCLPRMDKLIDTLLQDLGEKRLDASVSESALPDALQEAVILKGVADTMDACGSPEAAMHFNEEARGIVSKELNELDGFDR